MTKVASIAAQVDGERVLCKISMEILQEKFQASADEPMVAVAANRSTIQAAARKLLESNAHEKDGYVTIGRADL